MATAILDILVGAVRAFLSLGPLPVVVLVVAVVWLIGARIFRVLEAETRRRPAFWLALWLWYRRRR
jgi:hypothetical protein